MTVAAASRQALSTPSYPATMVGLVLHGLCPPTADPGMLATIATRTRSNIRPGSISHGLCTGGCISFPCPLPVAALTFWTKGGAEQHFLSCTAFSKITHGVATRLYIWAFLFLSSGI